MMIDGVLAVSASELAEFANTAAVQPIALHTWWIHLDSGVTNVTRDVDGELPPPRCARLLTGPDPDWVNQWGGDLQRACDEQINPMLAAVSDELRQVD
ncbi:hypothetical protein ACIGKR_29765 [Rhodococcus qingshengii]|uniref:hypothetical protein n=1 Tax=Rhodococcus qingshengii TaxID=334542 RepID=UPI0037C9855F